MARRISSAPLSAASNSRRNSAKVARTPASSADGITSYGLVSSGKKKGILYNLLGGGAASSKKLCVERKKPGLQTGLWADGVNLARTKEDQSGLLHGEVPEIMHHCARSIDEDYLEEVSDSVAAPVADHWPATLPARPRRSLAA